MGLFADKLEYLEGTKTAIKNAIIAQGTPILETDTFRSYANKIMDINTFSDDWTTQQDSTTDMLKLKKILEDDVQLDQGNKKILIATKRPMIGINSSLTTSFDKITGLKFVGGKYYTKTEIDELTNSCIFTDALYFSKYQPFGGFCVVILYFNDEITQLSGLNSFNSDSTIYICSKNIDMLINCFTFNNKLLYDMINCKIKTTGSSFNFNSSFPNIFANSEYLQENIPVTFQYSNNICNIDKIDFAKNPLLDYESFKYATQLRNVPNLILDASWTSLESFFYECGLLRTIGTIDTSKITTMKSMFDGCCSLQSVPLMDTAKVTSMSYMFQNCISLKNIPKLNLTACVETSNMFSGCENIESIELENTTLITSAYGMFSNCKSLKSIIGLDGTAMNEGSLSSAFEGCESLETIEFTNMNSYLDLSATTKLTRDSLLSIFNGLPIVSHPFDFKISKTCYDLLTPADLKIANDKLWFVYDELLNIDSVSDIVGTFTVGSTLTAGSVVPSNANFTYQWCYYDVISDSITLIEGATEQTYIIKESDAGKIIRLRVFGADYSKYFHSYVTTSNTNYITNPNDIIPPTISNAVQESDNGSGKTITAQSSDGGGFIYIVETNTAQATLFDIQTACRNNMGAFVEVTAANTDMLVPLSYLTKGTYYAYAVDASGNISTKGVNAITVVKAPVSFYSNNFSTSTSYHKITVTLNGGGKWKAGVINSNDITYSGSYIPNFNSATFTRTSDNVVTITGLTMTGSSAYNNLYITAGSQSVAAEGSPACTIAVSA